MSEKKRQFEAGRPTVIS